MEEVRTQLFPANRHKYTVFISYTAVTFSLTNILHTNINSMFGWATNHSSQCFVPCWQDNFLVSLVAILCPQALLLSNLPVTNLKEYLYLLAVTSWILLPPTTTILWPSYRTTCISRHPVMNCKILLQQGFTVRMPLLMATSTFGRGRNTRVLLNGLTCTVSIRSSHVLDKGRITHAIHPLHVRKSILRQCFTIHPSG